MALLYNKIKNSYKSLGEVDDDDGANVTIAAAAPPDEHTPRRFDNVFSNDKKKQRRAAGIAIIGIGIIFVICIVGTQNRTVTAKVSTLVAISTFFLS